MTKRSKVNTAVSPAGQLPAWSKDLVSVAWPVVGRMLAVLWEVRRPLRSTSAVLSMRLALVRRVWSMVATKRMAISDPLYRGMAALSRIAVNVWVLAS